VVDNSESPEVAAWLEGEPDESTRRVRLQPAEGWARAANRGLGAAAGKYVILFDPGVELAGDVAGPLIAALADESVAVAGAFGARVQGHLGHFASHPGPEVDVLEGYVLAFRREDVLAAGGFDPKFRFYRLADFELCMRLRDRGHRRALVVPNLPLIKHEHRLWEALSEDERERRSRRNYFRLLELWGKRQDLLVR
jgi:GT2 family glycosyltransferase